MRAIYAIGTKFAGGGIGTTAYHAVRGLHRHGVLQRLLCGAYQPSEIPTTSIRAIGTPDKLLRRLATYDHTNTLWYWQSIVFDEWSARQLEPCDIFHVWGNYGLRSLQCARRMGMTTLVERASSHPRFQLQLLQEEYARWGVAFQVPRASIERALAEMELADYIRVPSEFARDSFLAEGFAPQRLQQTAFGVDTQRFYPASHPRTDSASFRALFVGQVSLRKGIQYVVAAWRKAALPNAELLIVGQIQPDAASVISQYLNDQTIRWVGHVNDPVALYQSADVFVFPSIEEGSALVTYEAMACGLPSIVTHNTGSLVRDEQDGFVVPLRAADAIAEKLGWLYEHPAERAAMGRAARAAVEPLTWERYGDNLLQCYQACVLKDG